LNSAKIYKLEKFNINIEDRRIFIRLGYGTSSGNVNDQTKKIVFKAKNKLPSLLQPTAVFKILDYEATNKHLIFKDAKKVALCICTIGIGLEEASSKLLEKNKILDGFILDTLGSEAAEDVARQTDKYIANIAKEMGLWPSKRFSPGYSIWDIQEQAYLFKILPAEDIGVRLTDFFMMVPRKSVSFRINFYEDKNKTSRSFS
jgi:hypothetical protein